MKRTILVCGHGPGISDAVARRFGREGFRVAIVARNAERLEAAARTLAAAGVEARHFAGDLSDPNAVSRLVAEARGQMGPIAVIHWNAYSAQAGDLLTAKPEDLRRILDVSVLGLIVGVQGLLEDLKKEKGAVLVTGGGLALYDAQTDGYAVKWHSAGLAIGKAAQHKTVGLLRQALASDGIFVGEVLVANRVRGTAFDSGNATLDAADIAEAFWKMHSARGESAVTIA